MGRVTNAKAKRVTQQIQIILFQTFLISICVRSLYTLAYKKVREGIRNKQIEKDWGREENHRHKNRRRDRKTVKQSQRERHRQKDWYSHTDEHTNKGQSVGVLAREK
jgi:hypothetical protein